MASKRILLLSLAAPFFVGVVFGALATRLSAAMKGSAVFTDVAGSFADDAIGELYGRHIMQGVGSRHFNPNDPVTRAQLAIILKRLRDDIVNGGVEVTASVASSSSLSSASRSSASSVARSRSSSSRSSSSSSAAQASPEVGTLHFTLSTVSIPETAPKVSIGIVRTDGTKGSVSVDYTTTDGTAVAGVNYYKNTGSVTFADGEKTKIVSITLTHASPLSGNVSFSLGLSNPRGGTALGTPSAVTITMLALNPSSAHSSSAAAGASSSATISGIGTLGFSAVTYGFMENGGTATVTVTRDGGSTGSVSVNEATNEGSAQAGKDYTTTTGTLTFNAGETSKTFSIPLIDNGTIEGNRKFNLTLSAPSGGATLGRGAATVTIVDDETTKNAPGIFQFSSSDYIGSKGTSALVTVTRVGGNAGAITVDFATADASAISGSDYGATKGTLAFTAGETSKTFAVPISVNAKADKAFTLLLSNATGGATVSTDAARSTMTLQ